MIQSMIRATVSHAPLMSALHAAAFPPGERWGAAAMALQLALPGAYGWVKEEAGFVLARVAADEAEILTLAVVPGEQRRGHGRALLDAAMHSARSAGAAAMFLEVADGNEAAVGLYRSAGFVAVGLRPRYYPDGRAACVLRRDLGGPNHLTGRGPSVRLGPLAPAEQQ